ncbi:MAG: sigma-70 family RNA polymerase sigma factor [Polyangiales bacterium]
MRVANEVDLGGRASVSRFNVHVVAPYTPRAAPSVRDRRAFERAVLPCCSALRASARQLTKNRSEADDLLQETLLRAWRFWPRYREQDHCRSWLQRILLNTFYSERRTHARRRSQLAEYVLSGGDPTASVPGAEGREPTQPHRLVSHEQLAGSLLLLKPEQRQILRMVDVDERSYRETASELGCPIGTVMSRLHRARAALRTELAREVAAPSAR